LLSFGGGEQGNTLMGVSLLSWRLLSFGGGEQGIEQTLVIMPAGGCSHLVVVNREWITMSGGDGL